MNEVTFTVYGIPQPMGSVVSVHGNYIPAGTPKSRKLKSLWANAVKTAVIGLVSAPLDGALYCSAQFFFTPPRSRKVAKLTYCTTVPDLDKLIRGLWDPMHRKKGGLVHDDSRIAKLLPSAKYWDPDGPPRAEVVIGRLWDEP